MLKILIQKQLMEIFRGYFYDAKKNKKRSRKGTIGLFILFIVIMVGILGTMFTFLAKSLCAPLMSAGMGWVYYLFMGLLAIFLGIFGSVFNTYAGLYRAKDNDLLLSMPIPVRTIITARLSSVFIMGVIYSIVVVFPTIIVSWVVVPVTGASILGGIVFFILISFIVFELACGLGWIIAKISMKVKNKSIVTALASLLFVGLYYVVYFKARELIADVIKNALIYGKAIRQKGYVFYIFGRVGEGSVPAILITLGVTALGFLLVRYLISGSFLKVATSPEQVATRKYKEKKIRERGAFMALLGKEITKFFSSPNYMLNCGMGVILLPALGIVMLIKSDALQKMLMMVFVDKPGCITVLFCAAMCMVASMCDTAAPSVSLEGRTIWLLQSLPVKPAQVLYAKMGLQFIIGTIPTLFCAICGAIALKLSSTEVILMVLLLLVYMMFSASSGLFLGLKMPNLTWTNEIVPIKQSACVAISIFGGWVYAIVLAGVFMLIGWMIGYSAYLGIVILATGIVAAITIRWLAGPGSRIFSEL